MLRPEWDARCFAKLACRRTMAYKAMAKEDVSAQAETWRSRNILANTRVTTEKANGGTQIKKTAGMEV